MAIFKARTVVVPVWLLACALVVMWSSPPGIAMTGLLVLTSGLAALAILFLGRNVAPMPQPSPPFHRPGSWPDSRFRNSGRVSRRYR